MLKNEKSNKMKRAEYGGIFVMISKHFLTPEILSIPTVIIRVMLSLDLYFMQCYQKTHKINFSCIAMYTCIY